MATLFPCNCTSYNGGQCYNCINNAHVLCANGCDKKRAAPPVHRGLVQFRVSRNANGTVTVYVHTGEGSRSLQYVGVMSMSPRQWEVFERGLPAPGIFEVQAV